MEFLAFDENDALQRVDNDWDLLKELVVLFFSEYETQIKELHKHLESKNADGVKSVAHAIKGAAGNIGAMQVFNIALMIEKHGHEGKLDNVGANLLILEDSIKEFGAAFKLAADAVPG